MSIRSRQADQEDPRQVFLVPTTAATGIDRSSVGFKSKSLRSRGHGARMKRSCSSPAPRLRRAWRRAAGNELDPVYDSLAPVITLTARAVVGHLDAACHHGQVCPNRSSSTMRDLGLHVKGPDGPAVATLKRMQWTILEHDPFLCCMNMSTPLLACRGCPQKNLLVLLAA